MVKRVRGKKKEGHNISPLLTPTECVSLLVSRQIHGGLAQSVLLVTLATFHPFGLSQVTESEDTMKNDSSHK